MTAIVHFLDQRRLIDSNGIADGASIYFYAAGTLTPRPIYADVDLSVPLANPVVVGAGAQVPIIYLDSTVSYRRRIVYPDGLVDDADPYTPYPDAYATALSEAVDDAQTASSAAQNATQIAQGYAATSEAAAGSVAAASAAAEPYPAGAVNYVPFGVTSYTSLAGGSGGTNGTFALGFSGGNFSVLPTGTFTVAGGVVTSIAITGRGLCLNASPSAPTPVFSASSGLAGASATLVASFIEQSGASYWVADDTNSLLTLYYNNAGTSTKVSPEVSIYQASLLDGRTTTFYTSFDGKRPIVDIDSAEVRYPSMLLQRPGANLALTPSDYGLTTYFTLPMSPDSNARFHYIDVAAIGTATNPVKSASPGTTLRNDLTTVALGVTRFNQFYPLFDNAIWIDQMNRPAGLALEGAEAIRDRYNLYGGGANALYFPTGSRFYGAYTTDISIAISNSASTELPGYAKVTNPGGGVNILCLRNSNGVVAFVDYITFIVNTRLDPNYYMLLGSMWGSTLDTTLQLYEPQPSVSASSVATRQIAPDSSSLTYDGYTRQIAKTSLGAQFARPAPSGQTSWQYAVPSLRQACNTDSTSVKANLSFEGTVEGVTTPASGDPFVASLVVNGTEVGSVTSTYTGTGREVLTISANGLSPATKKVEVIAPYLRSVKFGPLEVDWGATVSALPAETRPLLVTAGTSITAGQNATKTTATWPYKLSRTIDMAWANLGVPSRQSLSTDGTQAGALNPRICTYDPFTNDYLVGQGSRTLTQSGDQLTGYIVAWFAANSDTNSHLFIITPWTLASEVANPTYTAAQYRTEATSRVNAWLAANPGVVDGMGRPRLHVIDGTTLVSVGNLSDGVHPDDTGHAQIATALQTALVAYK